MSSDLIHILLLVAALGTGLIAGVFFAFSSFVMRALSRTPPDQGIAAMQSINIAVINPVFLGVFLGTAILCAILAIISITRWNESGSAYSLIGAVLYIAGTFLVTMLFNIPLNNALAAADPDSANGLDIWKNYLNIWTAWNHVRTVAALAATALFIISMADRGSS